MSYDLHITRAEYYFEDNAPITLAEVEQVISQLSEGFSFDRTGFITATTPRGEKLTAACGTYLIYQYKEDQNSRIHLYFSDLEGPYFRAPKEERWILPMILLAEALNEKVQGDECEIYTKGAILEKSERSKEMGGIFHRLFHKK